MQDSHGFEECLINSKIFLLSSTNLLILSFYNNPNFVLSLKTPHRANALQWQCKTAFLGMIVCTLFCLHRHKKSPLSSPKDELHIICWGTHPGHSIHPTEHGHIRRTYALKLKWHKSFANPQHTESWICLFWVQNWTQHNGKNKEGCLFALPQLKSRNTNTWNPRHFFTLHAQFPRYWNAV